MWQQTRGPTRSSRLPVPPRSARRRTGATSTLRAPALLLLAATAATLLPSARLDAQKRGDSEPKRPRFTVARDSNSAGAYYYHGLSVLDRDPQQAADAFYWASRLDPQWADPYFARRVALHLTNARGLGDYLYGDDNGHSSPERRRADSLSHHAFLIDPFLYRRLERNLVNRVLDDVVHEASQRAIATTGEDPGIMPIRLNARQLAHDSPRLAAWVAYTDGNFADALKYFATAIRRYPKAYDLHADRADVFYLVAQYDSALVELQTMLTQMRSTDEKKLIPFYDSKAFFEYEVGRVHVMRGDLAAARAAYGRALTEDLSFYMAHAALADVALSQHDTATALAEYAQAVELAADEPGLRYQYGVTLFAAAKYDAAAEQFRKTIELDPYFAKPYFPLAYILEGTAKDAEAMATYESFISRAPATDSAFVASARQRVAELRAAGTGTSSPPSSPATSH